MNWIYILLLIVGFIVCTVLAVYFLRRATRKKQERFQPPQDVLNDFIEIERRFNEQHGEANPYSILYEYSREKSGVARANESNDRREQTAPRAKFKSIRTDVPEQPITGKYIQDGITSSIGETSRSDQREYPSPKRNFISRFRRR